MEFSGQADFRTVPGFDNWPRFVGVIEQNKISDSFCHYCMYECRIFQNIIECSRILHGLVGFGMVWFGIRSDMVWNGLGLE